jgi:TonB family protein
MSGRRWYLVTALGGESAMPTIIRACVAAALLVAAAPAMAQSLVVPKSNPLGWMTNDDYPAAALRANQEGRVSVLLSVDAMGRVTDCSVTGSSGSALLDTTTCSLFKRRGRFLPETDANGTPIAGVYAISREWRLAEVAADRASSRQPGLAAALTTAYFYCYAIEPQRPGAFARRVFLSSIREIDFPDAKTADSYTGAAMVDAWGVRLREEGVGEDAKTGCPRAYDKNKAWAERQWYLGRDAPAGFSTVGLDWTPPE